MAEDLVSAEAVLKSHSGRSLAHPDAVIASENVEQFEPDEATVTAATARLRDLGFTVTPSRTTLSLVGTRRLFEQTFGIRLRMRHEGGREVLAVESEEQPRIPESLAGLLETVVFPQPPAYFF